MSTAVCIFARPILPGATKTRLAPALGDRGAAGLYAAFLEDTLRCVAACPDFHATLWLAGPAAPTSLPPAARALPSRPQPEASLGERIAAALDDALGDYSAALAIGSDAPSLPPSYLRACHAALEHQPLAVGPTADGGFYALAVARRARAHLRDVLLPVRWSSAQTLHDVRRLAGEHHLGVAVLPPWYDVDEPRDLSLLRLHLRLDPASAPATARALAAPPLASLL